MGVYLLPSVLHGRAQAVSASESVYAFVDLVVVSATMYRVSGAVQVWATLSNNRVRCIAYLQSDDMALCNTGNSMCASHATPAATSTLPSMTLP